MKFKFIPKSKTKDGKQKVGQAKVYATVKEMNQAEQIKKLKAREEKWKACVEFYGDKNNWSRRESIFWESIDRADCADYPHITRDVRLTGGKLARQTLKELKEK